VGKNDVRNFRGGAGNRAMADLYEYEAGNGGYGQREPKATAPVLYSTISFDIACEYGESIEVIDFPSK
jgi:hypothetical protein